MYCNTTVQLLYNLQNSADAAAAIRKFKHLQQEQKYQNKQKGLIRLWQK